MAKRINSYQWCAEIDYGDEIRTTGKYLTKRAALKHEKYIHGKIERLNKLSLDDFELTFIDYGKRGRTPRGVKTPRI